MYIMAFVSDYKFNNTTRIGDDVCDISQKNVQNVNWSNYTLANFRPECPMDSAVEFAISQPMVNFNGSHQVGIGGCNINSNSELLITDITRPKNRISLLQRPFATVPYLGRGPSNVTLESQIQQGQLNDNRKSLNHTSEECHIQYRHTPMIDSLKDTITNPTYLVEGVASKGWIRGGMPSREFMREKTYN